MSTGSKFVTRAQLDARLRKIRPTISGARITQHGLSGLDEYRVITEYPDDAPILYLPSIYRVNPYYTDGAYGDMEESKYHAGTGAGGGHYYWYRAFCKINLCPLFGRILATCELQWLLASTAFAGSGLNAQLDMRLYGITDYGMPDSTDWDIATLVSYGVVNVYTDAHGSVYVKDVKTWIQSLIDTRTPYACFRFKGNKRVNTTETEAVEDGGLEEWIDANTPTHWTISNPAQTLSQEATVIHGGTYAAKCRNYDEAAANGYRFDLSQAITLTAGAPATIRLWRKCETAGETTSVMLRTAANDAWLNSSGDWVWTETWIPLSAVTNYTEFVLNFNANPNSNEYVFYFGKAALNAEGWHNYYFDDISVKTTVYSTPADEATEPADASNANNYRISEVLLYCTF